MESCNNPTLAFCGHCILFVLTVTMDYEKDLLKKQMTFSQNIWLLFISITNNQIQSYQKNLCTMNIIMKTVMRSV